MYRHILPPEIVFFIPYGGFAWGLGTEVKPKGIGIQEFT